MKKSDSARITDAVAFHERRGEGKTAVRIVRSRQPDGFRWRSAISTLTAGAGRMHGKERLRIEEPIREVVLDLSDRTLQRELVLDARRNLVDLDRGEILPVHTMGDLRRFAFLVGADVRIIERHVGLPEDFAAPIDTAGCILVGRAMTAFHKKRAQRIWLDLPDPDAPLIATSREHDLLAQKAELDAQLSVRWGALTDRLLRP